MIALLWSVSHFLAEIPTNYLIESGEAVTVCCGEMTF
jgi:hypothetical protein